MAWLARLLRQLAHYLYAYEPLGEERGSGPGVCGVATSADHACQGGSGVVGQQQREGAPGRDGRPKKNGPQALGKSRGGWTTKLHMVAADARTAVGFSLSGGQAGDAPEGRKLLNSISLSTEATEYVIMDKAYEGDETRQTVCDLGLTPVVPPKSNRVDPWEYDRELYKQRNEVERLFRRIKGFRRVFTRFDKLDVVYTFFVYFALIVDALNSVNTP